MSNKEYINEGIMQLVSILQEQGNTEIADKLFDIKLTILRLL